MLSLATVPPHEVQLRLLAARLRTLCESVTANRAMSDRRLLVMQAEHEIERYLFRHRDSLSAETSRSLIQSMGRLRELLGAMPRTGAPAERRGGH